MPDSTNLERRIAVLFSDKLNVQVPSLETDLIDTGLVDSLTFVEFLAHLEQDFGVHVSLEDLEIDNFRTIASIARFVATKSRNGTKLSLRE
ncbi:MAG: acyl carrier protein [Bacillati bacterium ANGP1]|uniref:Acyl carrier protein n=1 Tax=Candidatus Segetimicrobium genomatis TaxID=2569760 RepID=A0A537LFH0_9BACT|nr:MAG: acyl carrier protein [Terrabacteria group bacterium ANGP1]